MSRAGDVYENPVTGEWVMVGVGNEGSGGELSISDFYLSPGAVAGEHLHPNIEERFTVVRGWAGFRVDAENP
jgi:quercetin dioxygenase-like cupin family protein